MVKKVLKILAGVIAVAAAVYAGVSFGKKSNEKRYW